MSSESSFFEALPKVLDGYVYVVAVSILCFLFYKARVLSTVR